MTGELSLCVAPTIEPGMTVLLGMIDESGEAFLVSDGRITEEDAHGAKVIYCENAIKTLRLNHSLCVGFSGVDEEWRKALWHLCVVRDGGGVGLGTDLMAQYEQADREWPDLSYSSVKDSLGAFLTSTKVAVGPDRSLPDINVILCGEYSGKFKLCSFGSRVSSTGRVLTLHTS